RDVEAGLAVGEVERAGALRHGVPRAGLEQARRALRAGRGDALRHLVRARPEHPEVLLDALPGHAGVVHDAALRGHAQLLEHLAGVGERHALLAPERPGDVLDDPPVLPRLAGRVDGPVDLDDAALDLRDGP